MPTYKRLSFLTLTRPVLPILSPRSPSLTHSSSSWSKQSRHIIRRSFSFERRCTRILFVCVFSLVVAALLIRSHRASINHEEKQAEENPLLPPTYHQYMENERRFPQHNISLPSPEGKHAKFFWPANHVISMPIIPPF